jgi:hypothetical protein
VAVTLAPEGPQLEDLAEDLRAALDAEPAAKEFWLTLAQFYRRGYLRWIDATSDGRMSVPNASPWSSSG